MQDPLFYKAEDGTQYMLLDGVFYRNTKAGWFKMKIGPDTRNWPQLPQQKQGGSPDARHTTKKQTP